jgi:hypothetical protein
LTIFGKKNPVKLNMPTSQKISRQNYRGSRRGGVNKISLDYAIIGGGSTRGILKRLSDSDGTVAQARTLVRRGFSVMATTGEKQRGLPSRCERVLDFSQ